MELVKVAAPPGTLVERSVRFEESELFWLAASPFAVRCEPEAEQGSLKLVVAVEGGAVVRQEDRHAVLEAGMFTWLDSDAPFELSMTQGRRLLLRLPAERVRRRHPQVDLRSAVSRGRDHSGERIVAQLLHGFAREGRTLSAQACATAVSTVLEAVGLCPPAPAVDVARLRVERALTSIEQRLGDSALQPEDIAHVQGVSRRYLDGLLRRMNGRTLADVIRLRRLERAAEDLVSRPDDLTADIAMRWGFQNASHFTRLFRLHHGLTPTAYRRLGQPRG
jgi:AraC-like DNA-binding protein